MALVCSFMFKHAKLHVRDQPPVFRMASSALGLMACVGCFEMQDKPSYEFVLTFFFAYASFCIAEIISL